MTKLFLFCQSLFTFILFSTSIYVIVMKSINIDQTSLLLILSGVAMFVVSILCLRSIQSEYKKYPTRQTIIIPFEIVYKNILKVETKIEDIKIEDVNEDDIGGPVFNTNNV